MASRERGMAPQCSIALRCGRGRQLTGQVAIEAAAIPSRSLLHVSDTAAIPGRSLLRISDPLVMLTFAAVLRGMVGGLVGAVSGLLGAS